MQYVTPRPHWYRNATATYIRRVQYRYVYTLNINTSQESEYKSVWQYTANIIVQVHHYCTTYDIIKQEFIHDFDDSTYEFTSGTTLTNCYRDSRELS